MAYDLRVDDYGILSYEKVGQAMLALLDEISR
jgi:hypothetical protein